jgi:hypothetical protein
LRFLSSITASACAALAGGAWVIGAITVIIVYSKNKAAIIGVKSIGVKSGLVKSAAILTARLLKTPLNCL